MSPKIFLYWLPMIALAVVNGALRQGILLKHLSELRAHQLSTLSLTLICWLYTALVFDKLEIATPKQAWLTGCCWMLLTVAFEFTLGRLTHKSWDYLLRDYHIGEGRLWLLFLLALGIGPYVVFMIRRG